MQQKNQPSVTLILGGVRSGKSRYAQQLAQQAGQVTVVATAQGRDDEEMHQRIARHRQERPADWLTVEEPLQLGAVLESSAAHADVVLIDCLTLFTANLLETYPEDDCRRQSEVDHLCAALRSNSSRVILVANEVGCGIVPAYASGRRFRDLAGEINQQVAAIADSVLWMVAGLPMPLKTAVSAGAP